MRQQIEWAKELIWRFDVAEEKRVLSPGERWFLGALKKKMLGLCLLQRMIARQQSRIHWLREGDANTHFFHLHANNRRRRSFITQLKVDGTWLQSHSGMEDALHEFFVQLVGKPVPRSHSLDLEYLNVTSHNLVLMDAQFSEEEVWDAIKSLPSEKAQDNIGSVPTSTKDVGVSLGATSWQPSMT